MGKVAQATGDLEHLSMQPPGGDVIEHFDIGDDQVELLERLIGPDDLSHPASRATP